MSVCKTKHKRHCPLTRMLCWPSELRLSASNGLPDGTRRVYACTSRETEAEPIDSAAVNRWVAVIRECRAQIIDALKVSPGE